MNLSRIKWLFPATMPEEVATRQAAILTAICQAAKNRTKRSGVSCLTDYRNSPSIDDVLACLPTDYGTPAKPDCRKPYTISDVLKTLHELYVLSYIDCDLKLFDAIELNNTLFLAIAEEWGYARGGTWHRIDGERVFAAGEAQARRIAGIRLKKAGGREEVATL